LVCTLAFVAVRHRAEQEWAEATQTLAYATLARERAEATQALAKATLAREWAEAARFAPRRDSADLEAEAMLEKHGLKPVGSTVVLAAESEVQKKLAEIMSLSSHLSPLIHHQVTAAPGPQGQEATIRELDHQRALLRAELAAIDKKLAHTSVSSPVLHTQLVAQLNQRVQLDKALSDRIREEVSKIRLRGREAYAQAVRDLRRLVDATMKSYAELARNDEVQKALDRLGRTTKAAPELGPSREFLASVKLLEQLEKSLKTGSDGNARIAAKSKRGSKSKVSAEKARIAGEAR
jgi:hypothetical protein